MANLNPMEMLSMLKNGNPQMVATQIINNNYPNDPFFQKLLELGKKGDNQAINQFAQDYFNKQGKNINQELNSLMSLINSI